MIFEVTLEYQGKSYTYTQDMTSTVKQKENRWSDEAMAHFMYDEGNYACDCNRSLFIAEHCDEDLPDDFPELECGRTIRLVFLKSVETSEQILPDPPSPQTVEYVQSLSGLYLPKKEGI